MKDEVKGVLLVLCTALISGLAIPLNKVFVVNMDATVFTAVRALIIGIIFFVLGYRKSNFRYGKLKEMPWKYLLSIAVIGGALAFLFFFTGLKFTTVGRAAFLQKTLPLFVTVLAFLFLDERITKKHLYALITMFFGAIVLYSTQINPAALWMNPSFGDMLIVIAAFLWAVETIIAKKAMLKGETNYVVSFSRMFFGGLILFGVVLLMGKTDMLFNIGAQNLLNIAVSTIVLFGYVFTWYWGIKLINVSKASAMLLISPVVSLIIGVMFLGEPAPLMQIIGSAIILAGAYLVFKVKSKYSSAV